MSEEIIEISNRRKTDSVDSELIEQTKEKIERLTRHIDNVREACTLLGKKLIDRGEVDFGVKLISLGYSHDLSKFSGIEFDYLTGQKFNDEVKMAARHHSRTQKHHIEYWGSADLIPRIFVAEMCADWLSRSNEFGTSVWDYVKNEAMERYNIKPQSKVYKWIKEFLDLLLEKPFVKSPDE